VVDGLRLLTTHDRWQEIILQPHSLSHEYVTFGDDKKGKLLGTDVIKVNNNFTLKDVTLLDKLRYNLLSVSQLVGADLDYLFHKSGLKCLILVVILFVVFFALERFFKLIFLLLNSL
jgi:hypothetical protein